MIHMPLSGGPGVTDELMNKLPLIQGNNNEGLHLAHRIDKYDSYHHVGYMCVPL